MRARGNIRVYGVWRENVTGPHSPCCLARFVIVRQRETEGEKEKLYVVAHKIKKYGNTKKVQSNDSDNSYHYNL